MIMDSKKIKSAGTIVILREKVFLDV